MKKRYIFLVCMLCMCSIVGEEFHLHDNTLYSSEIPSTLPLESPLELSTKGVEYFFTHVLHHPSYCKDILPHSFYHLMQLLRYSQTTHQNNAFVVRLWRMFSGAVRLSLYIQPDALEKLLKEMISEIRIQEICSQSCIKQEISDLLYDRFLNEFESFKQDPESFFNRLSDDIITQVIITSDSNKVLTVMVLFFELCINKLAWNTQDGIRTWHTLLSLADCLDGLCNELPLPYYVLQDLNTALITRYCFFLELMWGDFSAEFLVELKQAVIHEQSTFLDTVAIGKTHREHLLRVITLLESQVRAQEYGYVSLDMHKHEPREKAQPVSSEIKHLERKKKRRHRRS